LNIWVSPAALIINYASAKRDANNGHFFGTMTTFPDESDQSGIVFTIKNGSLSGFPTPETVV
jgi:hypothetical protein